MSPELFEFRILYKTKLQIAYTLSITYNQPYSIVFKSYRYAQIFHVILLFPFSISMAKVLPNPVLKLHFIMHPNVDRPFLEARSWKKWTNLTTIHIKKRGKECYCEIGAEEEKCNFQFLENQSVYFPLVVLTFKYQRDSSCEFKQKAGT